MVFLDWTRDSLVGRLSLYFGGGTLLIIGLLGTVLFLVFGRQVELRDSNELSSKAVVIEALLSSIDRTQDVARVVRQVRATAIGHQDLDIGIQIDGDWVLPAERAIIDHALAQTTPPNLGVGKQMTFDVEGRHWLMHHFAHQMAEQPQGIVQAVVAIDVTETVRLVENLRNALIAIGIAGAAMIAALTWVAITRAIAPLREIAQDAERMTAQALDQPLSVRNAPIEIHGLVTSINQMLSRLKQSFSSLEQFSADIAHELRTPVNALLTQAQVTLSRERSIEEYRESLHQNLEELTRLQRMVGDMLFIARADRSVGTTRFEQSDLSVISMQVVEYVELIASENDQIIDIEGELTAPADPLMLRRALTNLLTNAVRYSPAQSRILVSLFAESGHAVVEVINRFDKPMEQTELDGLFDRFTRHSPGEREQHAGLGLGLSIVQSIMRLHGGRATASIESGLFCVRLRWPIIETLDGQRNYST